MHRQHLGVLLDRYRRQFPDESSMVERIAELVHSHPDCFERACQPGHITGSAFVVSQDHRRFLLTHHRKLDRWLQVGGHADGETLAHEIALREAREESGLLDLRFALPARELVPVDLDVHLIPARKNEPEHWHHDVRFCLVAAEGQDLVLSDESKDLRWFPRADFETIVGEESLRRLGRKSWWLLDDPRTSFQRPGDP